MECMIAITYGTTTILLGRDVAPGPIEAGEDLAKALKSSQNLSQLVGQLLILSPASRAFSVIPSYHKSKYIYTIPFDESLRYEIKNIQWEVRNERDRTSHIRKFMSLEEFSQEVEWSIVNS